MSGFLKQWQRFPCNIPQYIRLGHQHYSLALPNENPNFLPNLTIHISALPENYVRQHWQRMEVR